MKTKTVAADSLIPYIRNPRKNSAAVDKVAASIKEYGWQQPIVVDKENVIIAGHTRLLAAQKLGMDKVPVHVADLSDAQAKAYRLADNRISEDADWDIDLLGLEIRELDDLGFDLDLTGFDNTELANLLIDPDLGETDEDAVPEPPEEPISKPGDLWILGEHRLLCGDSTNLDDVERLMDGEQADCVWTDPPYGMRAVSKSGVLSKKYGTDILGDETNKVAISAFPLWSARSQFWFGANYYPECLPSSGCWVVWDKNNGESDQADAELCWTNEKGVVRIYKQASEKRNRVHPTQKPSSLVEWCFERWEVGDIVADPFSGSGVTFISCQKTKRKCFGMELDPKYCDVIVKRWEQYTSEQATLRQREAA